MSIVIISHFFYVGDNVIVGSKDGKLCWFDTDLSTRPYKTLKYVSSLISIPFENKRHVIFLDLYMCRQGYHYRHC